MAKLFGMKPMMKEATLPMGKGMAPAGMEPKGIFGKKKQQPTAMPGLMKRLTGK